VAHHALERLLEREISRDEVLRAITQGEIIERYEERQPYPSCLIVMVEDQPLHVVVAAGLDSRTCHIVTVYRPDREHFEADLETRRKRR
jgi:hypothetical protein